MLTILTTAKKKKKRNASEAKKTDHGNEESILFEKYQGTGALIYKQISFICLKFILYIL